MAAAKGSFGTNMERYQAMRSILTEYGHYGATGERPAQPKVSSQSRFVDWPSLQNIVFLINVP